MSYEILERRFYAADERTISATRRGKVIEFTAGEEDMRLIQELDENDKERLYDVVTIGGLLDPSL